MYIITLVQNFTLCKRKYASKISSLVHPLK